MSLPPCGATTSQATRQVTGAASIGDRRVWVGDGCASDRSQARFAKRSPPERRIGQAVSSDEGGSRRRRRLRRTGILTGFLPALPTDKAALRRNAPVTYRIAVDRACHRKSRTGRSAPATCISPGDPNAPASYSSRRETRLIPTGGGERVGLGGAPIGHRRVSTIPSRSGGRVCHLHVRVCHLRTSRLRPPYVRLRPAANAPTTCR